MRNQRISSLSPAKLFRVLAAMLAIALLVPVAAAPSAAAPAAARVVAATLPAETCTYDAGTNIRTCELWAKAGTLGLPTGDTVDIWGFSDTAGGAAQLPGPLLIANDGEILQVILHNDLAGQNVSLGFPGQVGLVPDFDGVGAGGMATYEFSVDDPGTFLYEAGLTPNGARQTAMGLYGALIVRPLVAGQAYDDASTAYDDEALLVLSEIDPMLNLDPVNFPLHEYSPRYWLINGQAYPDTPQIDTVVGNTILLRYANAGLMSHWMGLLGVQQRIIGSDGNYRSLPRQVVAETVAGGQTVDALVTIPGDPLTAPPETRYALFDTDLFLHNGSQRLADGTLAFGGIMTFLVASGTVPAIDDGPVATVSLDPANTTGAAGVTMTVQLDDTASGGQNVTQAEYFIDGVGAPGTGTPITIASPAPSVSLVQFVDATQLDLLASGEHVFYARGMDDLNNWGAAGSAVLNLDKMGPAVVGLGLSPNPSNGLVDVTLSGTGTDEDSGGNNVVDGEYSLDGGVSWTKMVLDRIDAPITAMTAQLASDPTLAGMAEGIWLVQVRALDGLPTEPGTWGVPEVINLILDKTGPDAPAVTLTPNQLDFSDPATLPTVVRLQASLADALSNGVQSTLAGTEYFVGLAGPEGTGSAVFPSDGLFDEVSENVYFDIPVSAFSGLASGAHPVSVRGLDAAGNWGVVGSADVTIITASAPGDDTTGPVITALDVSPSRVGSPTELVTLQAVASDVDQASNIAAGEWFAGDDPGMGAATPMNASDGAFDEPSELMNATIDPSAMGWSRGWYTLSVRAQDAAGNWGAVQTIRLRIQFNVN